MATRSATRQANAPVRTARATPARPARARRPRPATPGPAPAAERMSKVDTAWLRMDGEANLMLITGVWTLRPRIRWQDLCLRVQERLLRYDRFRQRVQHDATGARWVDDSDFDIARHVLREHLPRHGRRPAQEALQARVGELAMQPLDAAHPLWQMHLVEDYEGGSALIIRVHHCIGDGIALIHVILSLVDGGDAPPPRPRRPPAEAAEDWVLQSLLRPATDLTLRALGAAGQRAASAIALLREPKHGLEASGEIARLGVQVVQDALALLLMPDDTPTRLKGRPAASKRVAWCPPLPLDEVKAVGRALNCSVNDVLLSCVAGAIGEYLRAQGDAVDGAEIRAMVPVNLRPLDEAHQLGNRFGLVPLVLPVGMANPVERVYEVRKRMNALKGSTQPLLAFLVLAVAGLLVKPAQDAILDLFGRKTTAVMTNVPGPREKLKFLGASLEQIMFWVPQSGNIGLGVSILSYGGGVQFGVISDTALCPQPQQIIDRFEPEFAKLAMLALMLPWGEVD
ncbi:wax ester/triacylglycerol synthase family O-acyltransferase [Ramlibacter sp.]|nr:wax ester/triacylglycerol synthase family O-acyltransferase [Ramlibacter sp.]